MPEMGKLLYEVTAGCPVTIFSYFSYFLSLFLFPPIFKLKPSIFPIFLTNEAKIWNKIENGIIAGLPRVQSARGTEPHTHRIWSTSFLLVVT